MTFHQCLPVTSVKHQEYSSSMFSLFNTRNWKNIMKIKISLHMAPSQAITVSYITNRKYRVWMKDLLIQGHFIYFKGKNTTLLLLYQTAVNNPDQTDFQEIKKKTKKKPPHTHTKKENWVIRYMCSQEKTCLHAEWRALTWIHAQDESPYLYNVFHCFMESTFNKGAENKTCLLSFNPLLIFCFQLFL